MADLRGTCRGGSPTPQGARPPWRELEGLRPLTLRACRRLVVVAPHPRDEIRAAGGLLRRLAARHASVDVLALTDGPGRTCTPPEGIAVPDARRPRRRPRRASRTTSTTPTRSRRCWRRLDGAIAAEDGDGEDSRATTAPTPRRSRSPRPTARWASPRSAGTASVCPTAGCRATRPTWSARSARSSASSTTRTGCACSPRGPATATTTTRRPGARPRSCAPPTACGSCAGSTRRGAGPGPESAEVPWRRARQLALSETVAGP